MSKAFTREDDSASEEPVNLPRTPLPFGVKNYITPKGHKHFQDELAHCLARRSEELQSDPTSPKIKQIDARIRYLQEILNSAVVVDSTPDPTKIRFGAEVKVRDNRGDEDIYRIVGVDELDVDKGDISWLSPLAKALMGHSAGEVIRFSTPTGDQELTILQVSYSW